MLTDDDEPAGRAQHPGLSGAAVSTSESEADDPDDASGSESESGVSSEEERPGEHRHQAISRALSGNAECSDEDMLSDDEEPAGRAQHPGLSGAAVSTSESEADEGDAVGLRGAAEPSVRCPDVSVMQLNALFGRSS